MKSILKFIHVFLGVILFLAIGYGIQYVQELSLLSEDTPTLSDPVLVPDKPVIEDEPSSDNVTSNQSEMSESKDSDPLESEDKDIEILEDHDSAIEVEDMEQSVDTPEDAESTPTGEDTNTSVVEKVEEKPTFNYDMEAIDHHTIDHLDDMLDIIATFILEPNSDLTDLYNHLYIRNYMHFEKELLQKNEEIHTYISESLTKLTDADDTQMDSIIKDLNVIQEILINLKDLE